MGLCRDILVAFDGTPPSQRALEVAIELAGADHARLTILTAVPDIPYPAYLGASGASVASLAGTLQKDAERTLCEAVRRVPPNVSVTKICACAPIRVSLLREIERGSHDLVVLGCRPRGRLRSLYPWGLGRYVLARSPVPVLIVHAPSRTPAPEPSEAAAPALSSMRPNTA